MAIVDEAGQHEALTTGERALDLFTDRASLIRHFAKLLNEGPASNKILFFEGYGGNGKSLLLQFLERYYCKRLEPDNWSYVANKPDVVFAEEIKIAVGATPVPSAFLDFRFDSPTDPYEALQKLRLELGEQGIRFPLFDFACFWYLKKTWKLTDEQTTNLFGSEELDLIAAMMELVLKISGLSVVKDALAVIHKRVTGRRVDKWFTQYRRRHRLKQDDLKAVVTMDPKRELINKLPEILAKDLNAAIALQDWPKRIVLFIDGHEAFWGAERNRRNATYFQKDAWLRCLLHHLKRSDGIVAVVAGRESPVWPEADPFPIEEQSIDHRTVGDLSDADARSYLERALAGIDVTDDLYPFLCDYARVARDRVHPLYLAMCAEIVVAAAKKKHARISPDDVRLDPKAPNKARALINRFLSYADDGISYAVPMLSACRSFDRELYMFVGEVLGIQPSRTAFDNLIEFSFVRKEVRTKPSSHARSDDAADSSTVSEKESSKAPKFRIHDLLRRVYFEQADDLVQEADNALERYDRERAAAGDRKAIVEAIYHANRLDWEKGVREWIDVFEEALRQSKYELCQALLDVKTELSLETDFCRALVSQTEGDYLAVLARYDAAKQAFMDAIAAYDQAVQHAPDDVDVLSNKGNALTKLGDMQAQLSDHGLAQQSYNEAIAAYNLVLLFAPDHVNALSNKGIPLQRLGTLQDQLSQYRSAQKSYTEAIVAYDQALLRVLDNVGILNNKGSALESLGNLQVRLSQYRAAQQSYSQAIATYNQALQQAPDYNTSLNNKGIALAQLGALQASLGQHGTARQSYSMAIAAFDQALKLAPDDVEILNNKGSALLSRGDLLAQLLEYDLAQQSYDAAITTYNQILQRAPDQVYALSNKGLVLRKRGELYARHSDHGPAQQSYSRAIAAINQALEHAPNDLAFLNTKGTAMTKLGDLHARLADHGPAQQSYFEAIAAYDQALQQAPDYVYAHNNKGVALWRFGTLQQEAFSDCEAAKTSFQHAIAAFSRSLEIAPGDDRVRALLEKVKTALDSLDC